MVFRSRLHRLLRVHTDTRVTQCNNDNSCTLHPTTNRLSVLDVLLLCCFCLILPDSVDRLKWQNQKKYSGRKMKKNGFARLERVVFESTRFELLHLLHAGL